MATKGTVARSHARSVCVHILPFSVNFKLGIDRASNKTPLIPRCPLNFCTPLNAVFAVASLVYTNIPVGR